MIDTMLNNRRKARRNPPRCHRKKGFEKYSGHYQVIKSEFFMGRGRNSFVCELLNRNFMTCLTPYRPFCSKKSIKPFGNFPEWYSKLVGRQFPNTKKRSFYDFISPL
jgi:hypothetical protein